MVSYSIFELSTKAVDNFVDNYPLDSPQAPIGAGFNRMPDIIAKIILFKINGLKNTVWIIKKTVNIFPGLEAAPANVYNLWKER